MTKEQLELLKQSSKKLLDLTKQIEDLVSSKIAENDPEAIEADKMGSFPAWLDDDLVEKYNDISRENSYLKSKVRILIDNINRKKYV